ncbi:MAG TPA: sn-glycerol-3-phosphate ABC transporter ATP-binding protein UgpC [Streptosporangiaceae bacterium]|nr:sn-glycerol-3-phosphate ABC transporter ATP-binding protein UgpC [Streptosporangiaceae bacterium]
MAQVRLDEVTKEFAGGVCAVSDVSLEVPDGEFLVLVGPSGCGKTTALRLIAGLEKATSGTITIGTEVVNGISPRDRDIAMVFQNYALYPHMTVYRNLAFPLRERRTPKPEIARRVAEISAILGLDELLKRRPAQLSGGQRQRVAMGRALVREPSVFLLDEPLSNLDAKLRVQMRAELKRLHQKLGITTVYVTHDQVEAMTLADRIVVMSAGKTLQIGPPQEIYAKPVNLFVAGFIGSPAMNLLRGKAAGSRVTAGELAFERPGVPDGEVVVGIRPESLAVVGAGDVGDVRGAGGAGDAGDGPAGPPGLPCLDLHVDLVEPLGETTLVHGTVSGAVAESGAEEEQAILADAAARAPVTAVLASSHGTRPGDRMRVAAPPDRIYLFDAGTGEAIG